MAGVIRVEIDDFEGLHKMDELKQPIDIGGVKWTLGVFSETSARTKNVRHLGFVIFCNKSYRSNLWKVTASIKFKLLKSGLKIGTVSETFEFNFSQRNNKLEVANFMNWEEVTQPENGYVVENTAAVEAHVEVLHLQGIHAKKTLEEYLKGGDQLTDGILLVEGKKVSVAKQLLAQHSKFFYNMFYSSTSSVSVNEIRIDDVTYSEIIDFLQLIYLTYETITNESVENILKLAGRFQAPFVMEKCEKYLISEASKDIHLVDKLIYAEIYKLSKLQDHCLAQLKTEREVFGLATHSRYNLLGEISSNALLQRITDINNS
uniref:BTB domain-containing protein n=1 Tax=Caenorhabditis japonica TaxID=281687 RepID=A0A8R1DIJ4_CAEJA